MTRILRGDPLAWQVRPGGSAVAIGVFDGVHRGHQAVMRRVSREAHEAGLESVALTFDPHPLEFLDPEHSPHLLTSVDRRAELLGECGVDVVGVLPFPQIRDLDPRVFAVEILSLRLRAEVVAVGANFRFGRDRKGDTDLLVAVGDQHGFTVEVVDLVGTDDGGVVSSSRIRALVNAGDVGAAAALLGHPFELCGPVIHGDGRGRSIGFATANLHIPERMAVPANGVYATWAHWDDVYWPAVVNIGVRPTFGLDQRTVEAHLIGFDGDLYGVSLRLSFVERLRDEQAFDGVDALVAQIAADRDRARDILGSP